MEELDSDCLLELFEFLNGRDLEIAAEVCRGWNALIKSSTRLMKRIPAVRIDKEPVSFHNVEEKLQKLPYRELMIVLDPHAYNIEVAKDVFKAHGHQIDTMEILYAEVDSLISVLQHAPILTRLTLHNIIESKGKQQKIDLKNLKYLSVGPQSSHFIYHIGSHQIEEIVFCRFVKTFEEKSKVFLMSCDKLRKMQLRCCLSFKLSDLVLRLTKFDIIFDNDIPMDEFIAFLKSQKETLRTLKVYSYASQYSGFLKFIAFELQLEELVYNCRLEGSMDDHKVNKSIKKLELGVSCVNSSHCCKVISGLFAVEHLKICYYIDEQIAFGIIESATLLPKLRHLNIQFVNRLGSSRSGLSDLRFEQVETFETSVNYSTNRTFDFDPELLICPNAKKIILSICEFSAEHFKILLQNLKNLEEIYAAKIEFNDEVTDLILSSKLRKIELREIPTIPEKLKYSKVLIFKWIKK